MATLFPYKKIFFLLFTALLVFPATSNAQLTKIMGTVINKKTKNPIPFVNIYFKNSDIQTTTDFDGKFSLETKTPGDSLHAQYMGYESMALPVMKGKFQYIDFELLPKTYDLKVVEIRPGENPAEIIIKKVIKNKELNNKEDYMAFQYEAYTKVQIDANNYGPNFQNNILVKPFKFVFENADTSTINGKVYLPVFFTETLSDVYFRKEPKTYREIIRASKVSGTQNKSISQVVGDSYQKVNIYDNYNELFEKNFVSPIANFGLSYYKYYLIDSLFIDNNWCYHIMFTPRRSQELTYSGNIWIHDSTFGVKKVDMKAVKDANINFINEILVFQEFKLIDGKYWLPETDNLTADLNVLENNNKIMGMYVHKNTSYRNFIVNQLLDKKFYSDPMNIVITDSAINRSDEYWANYRHDSLTLQEKKIYKMTDTIQTLRAFKIYRDVLYALYTNYIKLGYVEFGPVLSTFSINQIEGQRLRIGFRTSNKFSKKLMIVAHGAYGLKDDRFKYGLGFVYMFRKNPSTSIGARYRDDVEQLGQSTNAFAEDYFLRTITARNPASKLSMTKDFHFFAEHDWFMGLQNTLYLKHRILFPIGNQPFFKVHEGEEIVEKRDFIISEIQLNTHFAFNEKFLTGEFERISIGTKYPKLDIAYTWGIKGCLGSNYGYHKLQISVSQWFNVGSIGWSKYMIDAGKVWGTLPYPLLKIHEGNETYMWDEFAFNTMNYYEFVSDQFVGLYYTHHFDGLLFNRIPLIKKLRWREVVYFRGVAGSLSKKNQEYSVFPNTVYRLTKPYYEVGAGIENIFKFMRIYGVWRLSYRDHPDIRKFLVMIDLYFNF